MMSEMNSRKCAPSVRLLAGASAVLFFLNFAAPGSAEMLAEQYTAMSVNDTLGGYTPSSYMGRRAPVGVNPAVTPGMTPGMMPMNMMGMAPAQPAAPPPVKKILVLTGERVECHVMGTLLEDIHFEYRPEAEKGEYYDDGTHLDLQADDNIWTNYTERYDVLSPAANRLKLIYLRMLELSEDTNPLEFFRIPVATEEPLSRLPRVSDEERDRDETFLRQWHRQFLALYRQDSDDPTSDFYPIFVPSPPRAPSERAAPPEDQFQPNAFALDNMIQSLVAQATASAYVEPDTSGDGGSGRRSRRRSGGSSTYSDDGESRGGGGQYYGDRWAQARGDAARFSGGGRGGRGGGRRGGRGGGYGTYQSSSYMRR